MSSVDANGNYFLGNLEYGNHSILMPSLNYLKSDLDGQTDDFQQLLITACTDAGIDFTINGTFKSGNFEINWSSPTIDNTRPSAGRFRIGCTNSRAIIAQVRDDLGNLVCGSTSMGTFDAQLQNHAEVAPYLRPAYWFSVSQRHFVFGAQCVNPANTNSTLSFFVYGGYLQDVNTNYDYYSANIINRCVVMAKSSSNVWNGYHYIKDTNKSLLSTADSAYPIICDDGTTVPEIDWTTGLYVFDNDEALGYPAIGRVGEMLASTSINAHTIGLPSKISDLSDKPTGSNRWLPVGVWLNKTLFIRIAEAIPDAPP